MKIETKTLATQSKEQQYTVCIKKQNPWLKFCIKGIFNCSFKNI